MTPAANSLVAPDFLTLTLGVVVYFAAVIVTRNVAFLRNYNIPDPFTGGGGLIVLCVLTTIFIFLQNVVGMLGASLFGLPSAAGVIMGSISLVGGHGTTIAWAPAIAAEHGFPAAIETGAAVATLGLIVASLLGGPVAKFLIERGKLVSGADVSGPEGPASEADPPPIAKSAIIYALLMI